MFTDERWYLVQCKPRESFRAAINLHNQGYQCFHPTYPAKRKAAGTIRSVPSPLFPHYLFIKLSATSNWSWIRSTRGVSRLICFNSIPMGVDSAVINALQHHCLKLHHKDADPLFKIGELVVVTEGCFKELEAIVTAATGNERVTLLINFFNRQQYMEFPVQAISRI